LVWVYALGLALYFYESDPAHSIARSEFPGGVCWWFGIAATGAALCRALWLRGLQSTAVANAVFWTCATWSLLANSIWVSSYSNGLRGTVWRSGWFASSAPGYGSTWTVLSCSAPSLALLLALLWFGDRLHTLSRNPDPRAPAAP